MQRRRRRRGSGQRRSNGRRLRWRWRWLPRRSRRSRLGHPWRRAMAMRRMRGTMAEACSPFYREGMLPKSLQWRSLSKSRPQRNLHRQRSALPPSAYSIHSRPLLRHPRRRRQSYSHHRRRFQQHQKPWRRAPPLLLLNARPQFPSLEPILPLPRNHPKHHHPRIQRRRTRRQRPSLESVVQHGRRKRPRRRKRRWQHPKRPRQGRNRPRSTSLAWAVHHHRPRNSPSRSLQRRVLLPNPSRLHFSPTRRQP
mmetsp:Transcript_24178/g.43570  ORF Transcript_24178/g.43570 Transcript_24178/m.43570 type:complete len:252 (-) Transcript_24178:669-1424(-)